MSADGYNTTNFDNIGVKNAAGAFQALGANSNEQFTFFIAGAQATGTKKGGCIVPFAGKIADIRAYVDTPPTTQSILIDVNKNGTTLFTTQANRLTIAAAGNASTTTAPDVTAVAAGDRLTFDIDQVGTGTAGSDLYVTISITQASVQ